MSIGGCMKLAKQCVKVRGVKGEEAVTFVMYHVRGS